MLYKSPAIISGLLGQMIMCFAIAGASAAETRLIGANMPVAAAVVDASGCSGGQGNEDCAAAADESMSLLQSARARQRHRGKNVAEDLADALDVVDAADAVAAAAGSASAGNYSPDSQIVSVEQPIMEDVKASFDLLKDQYGHLIEIGEDGNFPKGYNKGHMPYTEHFQGIQRLQGTNYLYISGSGKSEHEGQLLVAEIASRPAVGAMGSNMVTSGGRNPAPPTKDRLRKVVGVDSQYWHAGGITAFGNVLVVGAEAGCDASSRIFGGCKSASRVHFYDITDPIKPVDLNYYIDRETTTAGASALTKQDDGRFLLCVGRVDSDILDFYLSKQGATTLMEDPGFQLVTSWYKSSLLVDAGQNGDYGSYQNLNFVRQQDGKLFMVGTYRTYKGLGQDTADLYRISPNSRGVTITKVSGISLNCRMSSCNFQAGAGVYVSSSTSMLVYSTDWEPADGRIVVNEFRSPLDGVAGGCERVTSGTCKHWGCSASRGPTDCVDGYKVCVCKPGYCHDGHGKCVADPTVSN